MRDDISYIDAASAALSTGQGRAYSVRSSKISKKSFVATETNLSATMSKNDQSSQYSTLTGKKARSIFGNSRYNSNNRTIEPFAKDNKHSHL